MPGTKRSSEDTGATTRSAKASKTDTAAAPAKGKRGGTRKTTKAVLPATAFKAKAKPLHIHVSHAAPAAEGEAVSGEVAGQIAYLALTPSSFATGSYGWKGSKRVTIELPNSEGGEEKEKVTVMMSFNATVVGSKGAKEGDEEEMKVDGEGGEGKAEEHVDGEHTAEGGTETAEKEPIAAAAE